MKRFTNIFVVVLLLVLSGRPAPAQPVEIELHEVALEEAAPSVKPAPPAPPVEPPAPAKPPANPPSPPPPVPKPEAVIAPVAEPPPAAPVEAAPAALDPVVILREADQARGNRKGVHWLVELKSVERGKEQTRSYAVKAREFDFFAEVVYPPRRRGNRILMISGNMWFYKPDLSKPVPVSRRQKLTGNAAYGDIAATNYSQDYTPTLEGEADLNGEACYVYLLNTRAKNTTYDSIRYWISKTRRVGVKADYFTVSGKKFKSATMEYKNSVTEQSGDKKLFISAMAISDELMSADKTYMQFTNTKITEVPDSLFDLNRLTD